MYKFEKAHSIKLPKTLLSISISLLSLIIYIGHFQENLHGVIIQNVLYKLNEVGN